MNHGIDFVIIWVDGNDPAWQKEKASYACNTSRQDASTHRFRDWSNLQYWFRGVEKFCPWVRKIFFVTWGHLPAWLNCDHPKLKIVNHRDYIPVEYLPTFSSHTIELNLHRIEDLSEQFVYFNDDMFVVDSMKTTDFFVDGMPCDSAIMNVHCYNMEQMFVMAPFRDIGIINHEFKMKEVLRKNIFGWFNYRYGIDILRNIILYVCPRFPGILQHHLPSAFLKETFFEVWDKYHDILHETCLHKFRDLADVNQWVFREWQLASGKFHPRSPKIGKSISADEIEKACRFIRRQERKMLCLNDVEMTDTRFEGCAEQVRQSFESILPQKSAYER